MNTPDFNVIQAMRERHSVRTYDRTRPVPQSVIDDIQAFADSLTNPFGVEDTREFDRKKLKNILTNCCTVHFLFVPL